MKKPDLTIEKPDLEETTNDTVVDSEETEELPQTEGSVFEIKIQLRDITENDDLLEIEKRVNSLKDIMKIVEELKDCVITTSFGYKHIIDLTNHTEHYKKIKKVE